jgi:hypothetical protein
VWTRAEGETGNAEGPDRWWQQCQRGTDMRRTLIEARTADAIGWRAAGGVLLGLLTGLVAAWGWSLLQIWRTFF